MCRPCTTAGRHVSNIEDEQAVSVCIGTDYANRGPTLTTARKLVSGVCIQSDSTTIGGLNVAVSLGCGSVNIFDVSIRRVSCAVELEFVEKD